MRLREIISDPMALTFWYFFIHATIWGIVINAHFVNLAIDNLGNDDSCA